MGNINFDMNLESPKISLSKSADEVFDFLRCEKLPGFNAKKHQLNLNVDEKDKFIFALKLVCLKLSLQKKEEEAA